MNAIKDSLSMVSIWTGTFLDEQELRRYVSPNPDPTAASPFTQETGFTPPARAVTEMSVSPDPLAALRRHSYSGSLPRNAFEDLAARLGTNALFLVYGVDATHQQCGEPEQRVGALTFLGAYPFSAAVGSRSAQHTPPERGAH